MDRALNAREFTRTIFGLARQYRRSVDREFGVFGIPEARALPILYIARVGDGARQGELAESLGVEGPSLVRQIDQLCLEGLIERRRDPRDGRARTLHLTETGRALAARLDQVGDALRAKLLADVSDDDLATVLRVFAVFAKELDAHQAGPRIAERPLNSAA